MNSGSNFQRESAPTIVVNQTNRPQNVEDHTHQMSNLGSPSNGTYDMSFPLGIMLASLCECKYLILYK